MTATRTTRNAWDHFDTHLSRAIRAALRACLNSPDPQRTLAAIAAQMDTPRDSLAAKLIGVAPGHDQARITLLLTKPQPVAARKSNAEIFSLALRRDGMGNTGELGQ
jgi:hypothetical protein